MNISKNIIKGDERDMRQCIICGKKFEEGYNPKFDKDYGICKKCIEKMGLSDRTNDELKETFLDFV